MLTIPKKSFIPFVTAGHPDLETTRQIILALAEVGSSVIEIGIPFSDPIADGPTIQRSSFEALRHGYQMSDYLSLVRDIRSRSDVGLLFMTYLNPVLQFGFERLDREGRDSGLDAILISDLTPEEYLGTEEVFEGRSSGSMPRIRPFEHLQTVFLVAPTSSDERIQTICKASTGFVYLIARTGVTGKQTKFSDVLPQTVRRIRSHTQRPICVGFGIRSRQDIQRVWEFADGAIVGSAIVDFIDRNRSEANLASKVAEWVKSEMLLGERLQVKGERGEA